MAQSVLWCERTHDEGCYQLHGRRGYSARGRRGATRRRNNSVPQERNTAAFAAERTGRAGRVPRRPFGVSRRGCGDGRKRRVVRVSPVPAHLHPSEGAGINARRCRTVLFVVRPDRRPVSGPLRRYGEPMRDMNDVSAVLRESGWVLCSVGVAFALCYFAPDHGYTPVAFFSLSFYLLSGTTRLLIRAWQKVRRR
jgi:hypothetical protein